MSALARRLAALQRESGARARIEPAPADATPTDARAAASIPVSAAAPRHVGARSATASIADLRRLLGLRERLVAPPLPPRAAALDRQLPGVEIAPGLRHEEWCSPWPALPTTSLDLAPFGHAATAPERLCFFDTETTGLAGGTGTRAFQIGVGDWHDGQFRVRQLTMTALAAEAAMLDTFARWLDPACVLVSYNGRSYDAPLLATRYRLARRHSPLAALRHLDLLHPVRRRYRGRWSDCRLATIERELLGIVREDDLPGREAPRAWLTYLRGGDARDLRRVGAHNRQDLCSLAALLLRLLDAEPRAAGA
jgi:uncharacterized protein YprB with RNaseH-like and TPR domain